MLEFEPRLLKPGDLIDARFRLASILGEGGMATVWEVTEIATGAVRAIKVVRPSRLDATSQHRLLREGRTLIGLSSAHLPKIFEIGELEDGAPFIVMERLVGETLKERLRRQGELTIEDTLFVGRAICDALVRTHAANVVHRDLKPENVFLEEEGGVKLLDFGVAKELGPTRECSLTATDATVGTFPYMAPEQLFGDDVDGRVDVWALGVILYECVSGVRPTAGDHSGQVLKSITTGRFESLRPKVPACPIALSDLVARMLSRDPAARPSIEEVRAGLERAEKPSPAPIARRYVVGGAFVLSALLVGSWFSLRKTTDPPVTVVASAITIPERTATPSERLEPNAPVVERSGVDASDPRRGEAPEVPRSASAGSAAAATRSRLGSNAIPHDVPSASPPDPPLEPQPPPSSAPIVAEPPRSPPLSTSRL